MSVSTGIQKFSTSGPLSAIGGNLKNLPLNFATDGQVLTILGYRLVRSDFHGHQSVSMESEYGISRGEALQFVFIFNASLSKKPIDHKIDSFFFTAIFLMFTTWNGWYYNGALKCRDKKFEPLIRVLELVNLIFRKNRPLYDREKYFARKY